MEGISISWVAIAAVVLGIFTIRIFNRLIGARNACGNARAGIDANLAKRHDLVPNLVRIVRAYAAHEQETLRQVSEARAAAMASVGTGASPTVEAQLAATLVMLNARIEAYPQLRASEEFARLSRTLTEIEEQISASRRAFNARVLILNNLVMQFPTNLIARLAGLRGQNFFAADNSVHTTPMMTMAPND